MKRNFVVNTVIFAAIAYTEYRLLVVRCCPHAVVVALQVEAIVVYHIVEVGSSCCHVCRISLVVASLYLARPKIYLTGKHLSSSLGPVVVLACALVYVVGLSEVLQRSLDVFLNLIQGLFGSASTLVEQGCLIVAKDYIRLSAQYHATIHTIHLEIRECTIAVCHTEQPVLNLVAEHVGIVATIDKLVDVGYKAVVATESAELWMVGIIKVLYRLKVNST